jgi:hypothetical protein
MANQHSVLRDAAAQLRSERGIGALQTRTVEGQDKWMEMLSGCAPDHLTSGPALRSDETTSRIA